MSDEPTEPICSICQQVITHPELQGKCFRRKGEPNGIGYSFSSTLIQIAGGIDRLLAEWEEDPR